MPKTTYRITEDAWRLLAKIAEANRQKLGGEHANRNEDGTYTVTVDADFNDALQRAMRPGESLSDCVVRHLAWLDRKPS